MKLYNTLTRGLSDLTPLDGKTIRIYTCGLTVYSQPHIGNWLGYIYWDILVRTLRAEGRPVLRTQNITDVGHLTSDDDDGEDKMQKGARREGLTAWDVAAKYSAIAEYEGYELLGLTRPDHLVPATAMIDQQIAFARELDAKGYLYEIPGDGMYFDTARLKDYGKLARLDVAGLEAGARVPIKGKRNITDFAVWKFSPRAAKRDMEWDSPWGVGFPGWHLECSVIARETLGDQLDIHTGGIDHIPVHHTNEIAQTEAVTGKPFASIWLHNNHIKVDGQKMAKSLGTIYTLQDITEHGYELAAFKVLALGKHYRTEGNFTWDNLAAAQNRLNHWRVATALRWQQAALTEPETGDTNGAEFETQLQTALNDDLNTPRVLQLLDDITERILTGQVCLPYLNATIGLVDEYLGLDLNIPDITPGQKQLIAERQTARTIKDWSASDRLRDQLAEQGIGLRDTPEGALWFYENGSGQ